MKADCLASAAKAHLGDSIPHIHVLKLFGEEDDEEILSDSDKLAFPNALRAYLMTKLEDLKRGATVKGILPDCLVTVVDVKWYGSAAVELTYKDPASALSKACQYALTLWRKLTRFLEYPELELSNNLAENSMRPVALGRKNWLHIGSPQAGPKVAAILSVLESCPRLQVPVRDYLSTILPGLADLQIRCLRDLTPAVWVTWHS